MGLSLKYETRLIKLKYCSEMRICFHMKPMLLLDRCKMVYQAYFMIFIAFDFKILFILQIVTAGKGSSSIFVSYGAKVMITELFLYFFQTSLIIIQATIKAVVNAAVQNILKMPQKCKKLTFCFKLTKNLKIIFKK